MSSPTHPIWPAALHRVAAERDSARVVAVRMENEVERLRGAIRDLRHRITVYCPSVDEIVEALFDAEHDDSIVHHIDRDQP
jgi:uncharacterized membrane protein